MIPRFQLDATKGEEVFGVNDIKPLYPDMGMENNGREPLRKCDEKIVFIHLIKKCQWTQQ